MESNRSIRNENRRINYREHIVIQNIGHFIPHYLILWVIGIILSLACCPLLEDVISFDFTRFYAGSALTISITTITLALPTAFKTIIDTYRQFSSTEIIAILVQRFPITLLTLSAFTSLILSMLVASGFLGNYFAPAGSATTVFALVIMSWWTGVCIFYLFIAIEKMIYFVVNAPEAILDKLEFGVYKAEDLSNKEKYAHFRATLASINDIAATLVQQSTGRDVAIIRCLDALRTIHRLYLVKGIPETNLSKRKLDFKAVRAVNQELVRVYREAANAKNENATLSIINTWCLMVRDAVIAGADNLYIAELLSQMQRFQSYAEASFVEVIEEQVYTDWFFLLSAQLQELTQVIMPYTRIAMIRELSASLRRITVNDKENLFLRFMRVSSNSDMEINLEGLEPIWRALLDRAVLIYLTWMLSAEPREASSYLHYLRTYSSKGSSWMRSVLCDSVPRLQELLRLTSITDNMEKNNPDIQATKKAAVEVEEELIRHKKEQLSRNVVTTIIDDAEDINIGQAHSVSVVTKLVGDKASKQSVDKEVDSNLLKEVQTKTSIIAEDDPRVLGGTAAIMGLPIISDYDEDKLDDARVLAFLVEFSYVEFNIHQLESKSELARRIVKNAHDMFRRIPYDEVLQRKINLARKVAAKELFWFIPQEQ